MRLTLAGISAKYAGSGEDFTTSCIDLRRNIMGRRKSDKIFQWCFVVSFVANIAICVANIYYMSQFVRVIETFRHAMSILKSQGV